MTKYARSTSNDTSRRSRASASESEPFTTSVEGQSPLRYEKGDLVVDFQQREASKGGEALSLSDLEWSLLAYLVERRGATVPRSALQGDVWGLDPDAKSRVVDLAIHKLRKKIEPDPARPQHIYTIHGRGYHLVR